MKRAKLKSEVAEYKVIPASQCYRHLNLDWNWQLGAINDYMKQADPVKFAEFCSDMNLDAAYMLLVPHQGYTTYRSKYGPSFPSMRNDFARETIDELHKRNIAAIGYISLTRNWLYDKLHLEDTWYWEKSNESLCCINSKYFDLVLAYTEEAVCELKIDALRYDTLMASRDCKCEGCKRLYRELYGEELPDDWNGNWRRAYDFQRKSSSLAAEKLYSLVKSIKPEIEVWQNGFMQQVEFDENDMEAARFQDMAYIENGDPFRQLFQSGVIDPNGTIVGSILTSQNRDLCYALGGRLYQFFPVNRETFLPENRDWYYNDLRPFYLNAEKLLPFVKGATPVSNIGIVFCESTRYRYEYYNRDSYVGYMRQITEKYLKNGTVVRFISNLDIGVKDGIFDGIDILYLPSTSGLSDVQERELFRRLEKGTPVILSDGALRYKASGEPYVSDRMALVSEHETWQINIDGTTVVEREYRKGTIYESEDAIPVDTAIRLIDSILNRRLVDSDGQCVLTRRNDGSGYYLHIIGTDRQHVTIDNSKLRISEAVPAYPADMTFKLAINDNTVDIQTKEGEKHRIVLLR